MLLFTSHSTEAHVKNILVQVCIVLKSRNETKACIFNGNGYRLPSKSRGEKKKIKVGKVKE